MTESSSGTGSLRDLGDAIAAAINSRDTERFARHWTADGVWEVTAPVDAVFRGRAEIRKGADALLGRWDFLAQLPFAFRADVSGERAQIHWTMIDIARSRDNRAGQTRVSLVIDEALREADEWRLLSRKQHVAYSDSIQLVGQAFHLDAGMVEQIMRLSGSLQH